MVKPLSSNLSHFNVILRGLVFPLRNPVSCLDGGLPYISCTRGFTLLVIELSPMSCETRCISGRPGPKPCGSRDLYGKTEKWETMRSVSAAISLINTWMSWHSNALCSQSYYAAPGRRPASFLPTPNITPSSFLAHAIYPIPGPRLQATVALQQGRFSAQSLPATRRVYVKQWAAHQSLGPVGLSGLWFHTLAGSKELKLSRIL